MKEFTRQRLSSNVTLSFFLWKKPLHGPLNSNPIWVLKNISFWGTCLFFLWCFDKYLLYIFSKIKLINTPPKIKGSMDFVMQSSCNQISCLIQIYMFVLFLLVGGIFLSASGVRAWFFWNARYGLQLPHYISSTGKIPTLPGDKLEIYGNMPMVEPGDGDIWDGPPPIALVQHKGAQTWNLQWCLSP